MTVILYSLETRVIPGALRVFSMAWLRNFIALVCSFPILSLCANQSLDARSYNMVAYYPGWYDSSTGSLLVEF